MNEKTLLKIAFVCSFIGIAMIIAMPFILGTEDIKISEVKEKDIGKKVAISGAITVKVQRDNLTILELNDGSGKIEIVFFERIYFKGKEAKITGEINQYKGKLQLKGEKIE